MTILFNDLYAHHAPLEEEFVAAFREILHKSSFALGPYVEAFEERFAAYCGSPHCAGVSSGFDALYLALSAHEIGPGDEVITVANTFISTALAIAHRCATPVLVDCDPVTYNIDPAAVEAAVTPKTRAVIPVHLYGQAADMDAVRAVAERHDLIVIEDAAQAHGTLYKGKHCGTMSSCGCFSFYPGKNLGALGEGGAVLTADAGMHETILKLRNIGSTKKYQHDIKGGNYRLDALQGAFLEIKLKHLDAWNERRRQVAAIYNGGLDAGKYGLPTEHANGRHVYHLYVIRCGDRDGVMQALETADIQCGIHYPNPIHRTPAFADLGKGPGSFPVVEKLAGEILSLPMHPFLSDDDAERVVDVLNGLDVPPPE